MTCCQAPLCRACRFNVLSYDSISFILRCPFCRAESPTTEENVREMMALFCPTHANVMGDWVAVHQPDGAGRYGPESQIELIRTRDAREHSRALGYMTLAEDLMGLNMGERRRNEELERENDILALEKSRLRAQVRRFMR